MSNFLRATDDAERFLSQFDYEDGSVAAGLINSLVLVSQEDFVRGLVDGLDAVASHGSRPIALFSMREVDSDWYFDDFDPKKRPHAVGQGAGVGSEGPVSNIIRDFVRSRGTSVALDHPSISSMRAAKLDKIVVVDDIVGTGSRAMKFIRWLSRNRTLRSWLSLGYVRFHVVTYASTIRGKALLEEMRTVDAVSSIRVAESGRQHWDKAERQEYVSLCDRYRERTSRPFWPLGFGRMMTMVVFQHKVPNTTPAIFWAGSKNWHPLLAQRPDFNFTSWPENPPVEERHQRALRALGQNALSELEWTKYVSPEAALRFIVLATIAKRRFDLQKLSAITEIAIPDCERLLRECRAFGWLAPGNLITRDGLAELKYARSTGIVLRDEPELTDEIYVPQSFRGSSG